jgi:hypothetical protein
MPACPHVNKKRRSPQSQERTMLDVAAPSKSAPPIPFDTAHLDRLMEDAGIDVLIANSKHNIQYLLGGHRSLFFDYMDATGLSRYLPLVIYPKGAPEGGAGRGTLASSLLRGLDVLGQVEAHAHQVSKQVVEPLHVYRRQRGAEDRGDVGAQVLPAAGTEQNHVDAGLMPGKAVGGLDQACRAALVHQEAQRFLHLRKRAR